MHDVFCQFPILKGKQLASQSFRFILLSSRGNLYAYSRSSGIFIIDPTCVGTSGSSVRLNDNKVESCSSLGSLPPFEPKYLQIDRDSQRGVHRVTEHVVGPSKKGEESAGGTETSRIDEW